MGGWLRTNGGLLKKEQNGLSDVLDAALGPFGTNSSFHAGNGGRIVWADPDKDRWCTFVRSFSKNLVGGAMGGVEV